MDFWDQHSIIFVIGLIFWPRMLLLYFGHIPPMSIPPLFGLTLIPRMFMVSIMTAVYWSTNPILVSICWLLAVPIDSMVFLTRVRMSVSMNEAFRQGFEKLNREGHL